MKLGKVDLQTPLILAPMAGVTDMPYRVICRALGCDLTVSEMISAKGILYNNEKTLQMLTINPAERPTALQLFGSVPQELAAAAKVMEKAGADIIDFNMGCPVAKIVNNGEGSSLMKKPELAYEILAAMADAVHIPVTVKMRSGWDAEHINAPEMAALAEKAGIAAVAIHGRTRDQFYGGKADWQVIKTVKETVHIPVIGNGDIFTARDGLRMLAETGCDGLMVGRGADGNPWIFKQLQAALKGKEIPEVKNIDKFRMLRLHARMLCEFKGDNIGMKEMRTHAAAYIKGMPRAATYRNNFFAVNTLADLDKALQEYADFLGISFQEVQATSNLTDLQ
jgi:tRNA-dihydrouridine synthase B